MVATTEKGRLFTAEVYAYERSGARVPIANTAIARPFRYVPVSFVRSLWMRLIRAPRLSRADAPARSAEDRDSPPARRCWRGMGAPGRRRRPGTPPRRTPAPRATA